MGLFDRSPVFKQTDSLFVQALQLLTTIYCAAGAYYLIRRLRGYRLSKTSTLRVVQGGSPTHYGSVSSGSMDEPIDFDDDEETKD